jgi:hypothetical protein
VEVGEIASQHIDLPGVFVARVVAGTVHIDVGSLPRRAARLGPERAALRRQAGPDPRGDRPPRRDARGTRERHLVRDRPAGDLDNTGFDVIEVPANAIFFKKMVRERALVLRPAASTASAARYGRRSLRPGCSARGVGQVLCRVEPAPR